MRAAIGGKKGKNHEGKSDDGKNDQRKNDQHHGLGCMILVLLISISFLPKPAAQSDKYSKMAPVDQYLMERNAEILLARSAAPDSISSDATILVLGRQGYETAVTGKNWFLSSKGTVAGERAAADSCVCSRCCKVVRWNGRTRASRVACGVT